MEHEVVHITHHLFTIHRHSFASFGSPAICFPPLRWLEFLSMKSFGIAALCLAWCSGLAWSAPLIARFETVLGDFEVVLDSASAPRSVENFIRYANSGAFDSTIMHRSTTYNPANIQIVQGGGFGLVGNTIAPVSTDPPIPLEATLPNRRGTIALARTAAADSATSQWFFNVTDNPGLDFNYAVFGRVLGGGQSVVDAMGAAPVYDVTAQLGFPELPLLQPSLNAASLLLVTSVRVENFAITNITRSGSTAELRWMPLSTNTPVKVQRTANFDGTWTTLVSNLTTGVFVDTNAPAAAGFYRVVTE